MTKASSARKTETLTVTLDPADAEALRARAKTVHGGDLSAVIAEEAKRLRGEDGRAALVAWLGTAAEMTPEEEAALRAEVGLRSASSKPTP